MNPWKSAFSTSRAVFLFVRTRSLESRLQRTSSYRCEGLSESRAVHSYESGGGQHGRETERVSLFVGEQIVGRRHRSGASPGLKPQVWSDCFTGLKAGAPTNGVASSINVLWRPPMQFGITLKP